MSAQNITKPLLHPRREHRPRDEACKREESRPKRQPLFRQCFLEEATRHRCSPGRFCQRVLTEIRSKSPPPWPTQARPGQAAPHSQKHSNKADSSLSLRSDPEASLPSGHPGRVPGYVLLPYSLVDSSQRPNRVGNRHRPDFTNGRFWRVSNLSRIPGAGVGIWAQAD